MRCCVDNCNKAAIGKYQLCRMHHSSITGEDMAEAGEGDEDADAEEEDDADSYALDGVDGATSQELLALSSLAAGNSSNALRQKAAEVFESMNGRVRSLGGVAAAATAAGGPGSDTLLGKRPAPPMGVTAGSKKPQR